MITANILSGCVSTHGNDNGIQTDLNSAAENNIQLGLTYLGNDNVRAKEKLLLALEQAPDLQVTQDAMAYFLEVTGDKTQAEEYYLKAIKAGVKHNGAAFNNYAVFLCRSHRFVEADKMFLKALDDPYYINIASVYENAGLCEMAVSHQKKAQYYFEKAKEQKGYFN